MERPIENCAVNIGGLMLGQSCNWSNTTYPFFCDRISNYFQTLRHLIKLTLLNCVIKLLNGLVLRRECTIIVNFRILLLRP